MFCPQCGKENQPQAKFCHQCGSPLPVAASTPQQPQPQQSMAAQQAVPQSQPAPQPQPVAQQPTPQSQAAQPQPQPAAPDQGNVTEQVGQTRRSARRKMPLMLLVVLIALACASAAFATYYVYTTFIAPAIQQQSTATVTEDEAKEDEEGQGEKEAEEAEQDPETAQKAIFNDVLSAYKTAQDNGWPSSTYDKDLENLSDVKAGRLTYDVGPYDFQNGEELKYAYQDLNGDGAPELVIGAVGSDSFYVVAVYANNDGAALSTLQGELGRFCSCTLFKSGEIAISSTAYSGTVQYYHIDADGTRVLDTEATTEQLLSGEVTIDNLGDQYAAGDFSWTALSDFKAVE